MTAASAVGSIFAVTPRPPRELGEALDALPEAVLLVCGDGRVAFANRAALAELAVTVFGNLSEGLVGDAGAMRRYLSRCLGVDEPLPGGLLLRVGDGVARFQASGRRLALGGEALVMLRLRKGGDPRFAALNAKIAELDAEVTRRRQSEARLARTVEERDLLLRELQHRVKNNLQMLVGLVRATARETAAPAAAEALVEVAGRISAVGVGQQLLYSLDRLETVESQEFFSTISAAALALDGGRVRLELEVEPVEIANDKAAPLALILNELLTNAVKHAGADRAETRVRVRFSRSGRSVELSVEDDGPGFEPEAAERAASRRASGLGLVRGLATQINGALTLERAPGGGGFAAVRFICSRAQPLSGAVA